MKFGFYPKLAWTGIQKNRRLYIPYLLTCIGTVMMFYIICYLGTLPDTITMKGGRTMAIVMQLGQYVIALFAIIFLFYTHSFLIRRRNKEFGLYNVLGMDKRNIGRILFWETLITAAISLILGLSLGILFSKLAELAMVKVLHEAVTYSMAVNFGHMLSTVVLFSLIFLAQLLVSLFRVRLNNPMALLHSENVGEKPPKANWFFAVTGIVILAGAYYLAVSIQEPISAILWFFVAVLMVIAATYLLFIAGSVALCRVLQKKKSYYYSPKHFVSVSTMVYRMKRNGAGLASICILITMVLVMLSSTSCMFFGSEDSLRQQHPYDFDIYMTTGTERTYTDEDFAHFLGIFDTMLSSSEAKDINYYALGASAGVPDENGRFELDASKVNMADTDTYEKVRGVYFLSLKDYNRMSGQALTLEADEALVYSTGTPYPYAAMTFDDTTFHIKGQLDNMCRGVQQFMPVTCYYFVVADLEETLAPFAGRLNSFGMELVTSELHYAFNMVDPSSEKASVFMDTIFDTLHTDYIDTIEYQMMLSVQNFYGIRNEYYELYSGLFFLGIMLSIVFVSAAVLIIYYKQITEGYEDQSRFDIMQKVGMTRREIRKSINSQVLTVFFLPLLMAGIHLAFAFPMVWKVLQFLGVTNLTLLLGVNIGCFLLFGIFYALVYKKTSDTYYKIVSA